jgi:hypothetical protein
VSKPLSEWGVLIRDHHEGYISWAQFEKIQKMLKNNVAGFEPARHGAAKAGTALLAGLLRCRRCGRKLMVNYTGTRHWVPRYCCHRGRRDQGDASCISFGGAVVDAAVARELLRVVQPCAVEAAALAVADGNREQDVLVKALLLELKSARYEADRAWKQYDAVDPENRLVADELEHRWNVALEKVREVEGRLQREEERAQQSPHANPETLRGLAGELERAWSDPQTDIRLKKRIARALLFEIVADIDEDSGEVDLLLHWQGGIHTALRVRRRRRGSSSHHTSEDTVDAIRVLARVCSDAIIASFLNRNGLRTGRGNRWTQERVTSARCKRGIPQHDRERQNADGWMTLSQAARYVGTTTVTLRRAVDDGLITALHPLPYGPWLLRRSELDAARAQKTVRPERVTPETPDPRQLNLMIPHT